MLPNVRTGYDSDSTYLGTHFGIGKLMRVGNNCSLDLFGKYFYTYQQGNNETLTTGEEIRFDDVNSHRLRFGTRLSGGVRNTLSPYIGAAWEYECDGTTHATTNSLGIDAPSLRGSSGLGEIGVSLKPAFANNRQPLTVDVGVQGFVGKREGVAANMQVCYSR